MASPLELWMRCGFVILRQLQQELSVRAGVGFWKRFQPLQSLVETGQQVGSGWPFFG